MSRAFPAALTSHLAGSATTLAYCWTITRADGEVFRYTSHDQDVVDSTVSPELRWRSELNFTRSAINNDDSLKVDAADVQAIIDSSYLEENDIRSGKFDGAEIELFLFDWEASTLAFGTLLKGKLGQIELGQNGIFNTELVGLERNYVPKIGSLYSPTCRYDLGDSKCTVALTGSPGLGVNGTVTGVTDNRVFQASALTNADDTYFKYGYIEWLTGLNAGLKMEVKTYDQSVSPGPEITLFLPMFFSIVGGDTFTAYPGCDKTWSTCKSKFDNLINFGGEPDVPGQDRAFIYQSADTLK